MKFWKVAALIALAAIPLLLIGKKKIEEKGFQPESGDVNDIFERELTAE
jgi:hypothetical protein